jgi:hypothetical protein
MGERRGDQSNLVDTGVYMIKYIHIRLVFFVFSSVTGLFPLYLIGCHRLLINEKEWEELPSLPFLPSLPSLPSKRRRHPISISVLFLLPEKREEKSLVTLIRIYESYKHL